MYSNSPIKRFAIFNPSIIYICLNCNMQLRFWHPQVGAWDQVKCGKKVRQMNVELDFLLSRILHMYDCMQTSLYQLYALFCNAIRICFYGIFWAVFVSLPLPNRTWLTLPGMPCLSGKTLLWSKNAEFKFIFKKYTLFYNILVCMITSLDFVAKLPQLSNFFRRKILCLGIFQKMIKHFQKQSNS